MTCIPSSLTKLGAHVTSFIFGINNNTSYDIERSRITHVSIFIHDKLLCLSLANVIEETVNLVSNRVSNVLTILGNNHDIAIRTDNSTYREFSQIVRTANHTHEDRVPGNLVSVYSQAMHTAQDTWSAERTGHYIRANTPNPNLQDW